MALQPAAGTRDRHPGEVRNQRRLCEQLAGIYRLWGYREVSPPGVERIDTLLAGGGVAEADVVRLVQAEPLGLRPEFTASIARAAGTRFADRPRPLRLWASGPTFRQVASEDGTAAGLRIQEQIQSGVELFGDASAAAERELLHLLIAAVECLGLQHEHNPRLLVGHHGILSSLLDQVPADCRQAVRRALTQFDVLGLEALPLEEALRQRLCRLIGLRGSPSAVLALLGNWLGQGPDLQALAGVLAAIDGRARQAGIVVQFDPTFQPHFHLYDGLVFQLVCQGSTAPVVIASGGRYDALVRRFSETAADAAGMGFAFAIDAISDLLETAPAADEGAPWLVAGQAGVTWDQLVARMLVLHGEGQAAELCSQACSSSAEAEALARRRGCRGAIWLPGPESAA